MRNKSQKRYKISKETTAYLKPKLIKMSRLNKRIIASTGAAPTPGDMGG